MLDDDTDNIEESDDLLEGDNKVVFVNHLDIGQKDQASSFSSVT
jgi:hypothetical protein